MNKRLVKMRIAAHLLPAPGGEIVWDLVGEIDRLQSAATAWFDEAQDHNEEIRRLRLVMNRQKEYLDKQIDDLLGQIQQERYGSYHYEDLRDQRHQLLIVRHANRRISEELKLDERVVSEPTEFCPDSGVPLLPIPDFCTLYRCVATSYRANYEGGKYNCIGDETRRLAKNEYGFLTCPTCHNSYGSG